MTITKESALNDQEWHLNGCKRETGPRGGVTETIRRVRRSGRTQTWKRDADRFSFPVKYGLYESLTITNDNGEAERFHPTNECPLDRRGGYEDAGTNRGGIA